MASSVVDIIVNTRGQEKLKELQSSLSSSGVSASRAQRSLENWATASQRVQKAADGCNTEITELTRNANGLGGATDGMVGKFAALAAQLGLTISAVALFKSSLDAAFARENAENRLQSLTNSAQEYDLAMGAAEIASRRFGITQTEAANALGDIYGRLKGLGLSLAEVNEIYTGFNVIAREARVSSEDAAGAFLQLSQAMGSGKLQGDELKLILERMPQLAQAIADGMGVSAGSIRQLASDGKVGLTQIQQALSGAAQRADELGSTFTSQQATMAQVAQRWEETRIAIGNMLAPAYLEGINTLAKGAFLLGEYMKSASTWVSKNAETLQRLVTLGIEVGKIAASIGLVIMAYQAWQKAIAAVAVAKAFLLGLTGVGVVKIALGAAAAAAAYHILGKGISDTAAEIKRMEGESEAAFQKRKAQVEAELAAQKALDDSIRQTTLSAEDLKKAQAQVTKEIQASAQAADQLAQKQTTKIEQGLQIAQARLQTEQAINNVKLQQAERDLQGANNARQREEAAQRIYRLTVANAEAELRSPELAIQAEVRKAAVQLESARVKAKQIEATVRLAMAEGTVTAEHFKALEAQRESVSLAEDALRTAIAVGNEQQKAARAVYDGKVAAAGAAYEQNRVYQATQGAASAAGQFASNMQSAASAASSAASSMQQAASAGGGGGKTPMDQAMGQAMGTKYFAKRYYDQYHEMMREMQEFPANGYWERKHGEFQRTWMEAAETINRAMAREAIRSAQEALKKYASGGSFGGYLGSGGTGSMGASAFAEGGYVTTPTNALIGEGGEPELVIPQSKMDQAMANYAAGYRGADVLQPQVNITTGPVQQIDGRNYVTQQDLMQATRSAAHQGAKQALSSLRRSPSSRRAVGV